MRAWAPGRVNLIGDHVDYTGGFVLPMAIDLGTTVDLVLGGDVVDLVSADAPERAQVRLAVGASATGCGTPTGWARYVAGVVAAVRPPVGGRGTVVTDLPIGAGLSSSAALEVALALALGFSGSPVALAQVCQRAEHLATGTPTGIMDQLASVAGRAGHALLIDCQSLDVEAVPMPADAEVLVVDSGERRAVSATAYADRRRQCEEAAAIVGPLRQATVRDLARIADGPIRRRARHVVGENARVLATAVALRAGDVAEAGRLMAASHASLRDDCEVSTPALDAIVDRLVATPGVHGARLTGAGFGGSVVALVEPGTVIPGALRVRAGGGAVVSGR